MEFVILIGFFVGMILLVVFFIRYGKKKSQKKVEWYQRWGLKLNLNHSQTKHFFTKLNVLSGNLDGNPIMIFEKIVGSGKHQTVYTIASFSPSPFDFDFRIGKEGFLSKVGKSFGVKDIEFDNVEFDKKFLLKAKEENRFRSLMDYRMQQGLSEIENELRGSITNNNGQFEYTMVGAFTKEERLEEFDRVLQYMRALIKNKR